MKIASYCDSKVSRSNQLMFVVGDVCLKMVWFLSFALFSISCASFHEEESTPVSQRVVNFAAVSAGAVVLESSPKSSGFHNLLYDDKDRYGIFVCAEKKWVIIGLSEDVYFSFISFDFSFFLIFVRLLWKILSLQITKNSLRALKTFKFSVQHPIHQLIGLILETTLQHLKLESKRLKSRNVLGEDISNFDFYLIMETSSIVH